MALVACSAPSTFPNATWSSAPAAAALPLLALLLWPPSLRCLLRNIRRRLREPDQCTSGAEQEPEQEQEQEQVSSTHHTAKKWKVEVTSSHL